MNTASATGKGKPIILILGSGRSGTTFLAKLFDSHPAVLYRHEPDAVHRDRELPPMPPAEIPAWMAARAAAYLDRLVREKHPRTAPLPLFPKAYRGPVRQRLHKALTVAIKLVERLGIARLSRRLWVPDLISRKERRAVLPVLKSVDSVYRAHLFVESGPDVKVIHILRHPCGVVASGLRGQQQGLIRPRAYLQYLFEQPEAATYGFARQEMEAASLEEQLAFQWMVGNDKVLRELADHPRYTTVLYEDLCLEPVKETERLFRFAGLDWRPETAAFIEHLTSQDAAKAGYYSVMRAPRSALYRWKQELSADQVARIYAICSRAAVARFYPDIRQGQAPGAK